MKVLGITGGVGSGKSRVLGYLEEAYGAVICQMDDVARKLQQKGTRCFGRIVDRFGPGILGADGELDRAALGVADLEVPVHGVAANRQRPELPLLHGPADTPPRQDSQPQVGGHQLLRITTNIGPYLRAFQAPGRQNDVIQEILTIRKARIRQYDLPNRGHTHHSPFSVSIAV